MSLIIAKIHKSFFRIESDTQVTFHNTRMPRHSGKLKSIIISQDIVVSFAGNYEYGCESLNDILEINSPKVEEIIEILLKSNISSDNEVEYILSIANNGKEIIEIKENKVRRNLVSAWIGNVEGFKKFQKCFVPMMNSGLPDKLGAEYIFVDCFKSVMNSVQTVGDFSIAVKLGDYGFYYTGSRKRTVSAKTSKDSLNQGSDPLDIDIELRPENGDFSIEYLRSDDRLSIGIYYSLGLFGVLLNPKLSNEVNYIKAVDKKEFINSIKSEYNIDLIIDPTTTYQ